MRNFLQVFGLLLTALMLSSFAQWQGRLSPDDQREFDKYYTKWVNDTRKNDRDDIGKDVGHMQEIMARRNIPADVPFDRIASTGNGVPADAYLAQGQWRDRLSPEDQRDFDQYYSRLVDDVHSNDLNNVKREAEYLGEIMARNKIPPKVPFEQIASAGTGSGRNYPREADQAWQSRLSQDDQQEFDKYFASWLEDTRKNDRDEINRDIRYMQEIMARNNIPANIPFDRIASDSPLRR